MNKPAFWKGYAIGLLFTAVALAITIYYFITPPSLALQEIQMSNLDGKPFVTEDLKDKPIVLNCWATWCGPCLKEFPILEKFKKQFEGKVNFIMVSTERLPILQKFKNSNNYTFTILQGTKGFENINAWPTTYIYDKNGQLITIIADTIKEQELIEILEKLE